MDVKAEVVTAALLAALAGLSALSRHPPMAPTLRPKPSQSAPRSVSLCPPGTLPDQGVCIPVARPLRATMDSETAIPKRADRPADYAAYQLPVASAGSPVVVGVDSAAAPDGGARRSGVALSASIGARVTISPLEGQEGPIECVFAGRLVGGTVITHHVVRTGERRSDVIVLLENLDAVHELPPKSKLEPGFEIARAGADPIHLEIRLVRAGVDVFAVPAERLLDDSETVAVDPRNYLPRRQ